MLLEGDYEPSPVGWVRTQVECYEATAGREANTAVPPYADYQVTTSREIPVFVVEPL